MNKKSITEFLSNEYKEFALYTIENRSLASIMDGFKISQRKIINASLKIWKSGNEKHLKVFQLSGVVAHTQFYHHGSSSLDSAIINMAQSFKNNVPLLEEDGQFGSLRSTESGAPRYIGTRLSPYFRMIYKDSDLLKFKMEEGEEIEPNYFLPIIPMILVNGCQGIAVGFSSNILNHNVNDIIKQCKKHLDGKKLTFIKPHLNSFSGEWTQDENNPLRWKITGILTRKNSTTIIITELPPSITYEKYETHLDKLISDGFIEGYEDNCKDTINYVIKFKKGTLSDINDEELLKSLKLVEYETENLTCLDENGKLKIFSSVNEMIIYFVDKRLKYYEKRKEHLILKANRELIQINNRSKFIKLILDGKIKINNQSKIDIITQIEKYLLDKIDGSYEYLLKMPINSLSKENFESIKNEISERNSELEEIRKYDPKNMYSKDIDELSRKINSSSNIK